MNSAGPDGGARLSLYCRCGEAYAEGPLYSAQFKNNYSAEMWSGSEEGSYLVTSLNSRLESNKEEE